MNKKKNFVTAVLNQIITLIYGLVVPRLVLSAFGSNVNGLISSITQFLSFISLLEGGLGAVILAELYSPIESHDEYKTSRVLNASRRLFTILGIIYIAFAVGVAVVYPLFVLKQFDYLYVFLLALILSLGTLSQYMFSITNRLFLQASQKIYIVNIVTSITLVLNIVFAFLCITIYPEIHVLKLSASIMFFIQPIIFSKFVDGKYKKTIDKNDGYKLENRWSGFAQNLAHFINMNTDIVLITVFLGLSNVSVYSVYVLAINALRSFISTINDSYQSAFGKYYVEGHDRLSTSFKRFALINLIITSTLFMTCMLLINPFVSLYTSGVTDADYYQPAFALIMVAANFIYCVREPFRLVVLSAGKFKETNAGALIEAGLNIGLSLILVQFFGLAGVAIGTLVAISFRMLYFVWFLRRDLLFFGYKKYIIPCLKAMFVLLVNILVYFYVDLRIYDVWRFLLFGFVIVCAEFLACVLLYAGPKRAIAFIRESLFKRRVG